MYGKTLIVGFFGILFWAAIFILFYRVLAYFKGIEIVGAFLAAKLLSMVILSFFSILIFSNIITALSVFFMSEELQLVTATPYDADELYLSKLAETVINSSWMVTAFQFAGFYVLRHYFQAGCSLLLHGPADIDSPVYYLRRPGHCRRPWAGKVIPRPQA